MFREDFFPSIGVSDLELAYYLFDYCGVYGLDHAS